MLTNENLSLAEDGIWWIRSSRKKTGVDFEIPLMELPLHIIEKYRDVAPEGKLLPMYSNSSLNHYLKQIAVLCGIERKAGLPRGPSYLCDRNHPFPWCTT